MPPSSTLRSRRCRGNSTPIPPILWIVDAYTLVMAGLMLSAGSLADRFGRRGFLGSGLAVFAVTSAVAAQVDSADGLIRRACRHGRRRRRDLPGHARTDHRISSPSRHSGPRQSGLWAAMVGVGVAVGPISGGWLLEQLLLGLDLPGQRADRRGGHHRRGWAVQPRRRRDPATPPTSTSQGSGSGRPSG